MKKTYKTILMFCILLSAMSVAAQQQTLSSIVSAGGTENNVYVAIGQPFYAQYGNDAIELSEGIAQAQLVTKEITAEICQNEPYDKNYFNIEGLAPGTYNLEHYELHVDTLNNYDLLNLLTLTVYEVYELEDEHMYHVDVLPTIPGEQLQDGQDVQLVEGWNELKFRSSHGCDSLVHYFVMKCPLKVKDADNLEYNTVIMNDFHCYTRENMRTEHYAECATEDVQTQGESVDNMVYHSMLHPNENENLETFGRLYTYTAATNSNTSTTGHIQGICTCGWHIPTSEEMALIEAMNSTEINSEEYWVEPNYNTNRSGFTALPAGFYNVTNNSYEGMLSVAKFWYVGKQTTTVAPAAVINYYCEQPVDMMSNVSDALSVRCVRNNPEK